jgi:hypothetical protein
MLLFRNWKKSRARLASPRPHKTPQRSTELHQPLIYGRF